MNLSKAKSLDYVKTRVNLFRIPDFIYFDVTSFIDDPESILEMILKHFHEGFLIIRSSAADEDGALNSSAGEYESVLNVPADKKDLIKKAIEVVLSSYEIKGINKNDEIIIQKMITNSMMSGVIFTYDLNTGAPYYVVNYDDESGLTDTVTSGNGEYANRTLYVHRNSIKSMRSDRFKKLLASVQELEEIMNDKFLDIEFAIDKNLTPILFQVRAITNQANWLSDDRKNFDSVLNGVKLFIANRFNKISGVFGKTTIFGQMPDWNPVEMIGTRPRVLALSLYQKLITDSAWSVARKQMGYKIPTGQPLMVVLAAQPFIDVRLSFNSFLPRKLPSNISNKLIDCWVDRLQLFPEFHDKVEFEVAITSFCFDVDNRINDIIGNTLTLSEKKLFKKLLSAQTMDLIKGNGSGSLHKALEKIDSLDKINFEYRESSKQYDLINLFAMIENCINLGTVPFSILARHGFIGRAILLSLKAKGVISDAEVGQIQSSVQTVASDLVNDMKSFQLGNLSNKDFMSKYGHLRPGTYDITSQRYDQMTDLVGSIKDSNETQLKSTKFKFSSLQSNKINALLKKEGFEEIDSTQILNYIHNSIEGREYGKFVFTNTLSNILELIAKFGSNIGLNRNEMSNIPIEVLLQSAKSSNKDTMEVFLKAVSMKEQESHSSSYGVRLPQLLFDEAGVHVVPFQVSHPNFITDKIISAKCISLKGQISEVLLSGKIVLIEGADPGFDWIFTQNIAGLITKYGGANSHMAIRCAEFGIPAAIGCGEQIFDRAINSNKLNLDCLAGIINRVH